MEHVELTQTERSRQRLAKLAWLLDAQFEVPKLGVRVGLDGLLGLVPAVGDAISVGLSLLILIEAARMGTRKRKLATMAARLLLDFAVGSVPVAGDVFDVFYKANLKNLRSIGIEPQAPGLPRRRVTRLAGRIALRGEHRPPASLRSAAAWT
mgnify:CR=1 FL=1